MGIVLFLIRVYWCQSFIGSKEIQAKYRRRLDFCLTFCYRRKSSVFCPATAEVFTEETPTKQQKARLFPRL